MLSNTPQDELLRRKCRRNYGEFVKFANPGFVMTHFHKYLTEQIQEFLEAETDEALSILLLSVPPRHGKSYTVTETLPAWYLGRYPDREVIICGYEGTFAESFSRRNRDKFNEYSVDVFNTNIGDYRKAEPNQSVQGVALWETSLGGKCHAAGLKGGITGFGADLFIIDDPIKNKESADSETVIAKIHEEMGPSVQSRIYPNGKLIVIQTRWVENDVVGFIEKNWCEYIWKTINLPCECEDPENDPLGRKLGDALMGDHLGDQYLPYKIRNDNKWLKSKKKLVMAGEGERTWNALYQGHPSAQNGNVFKNEWWEYYDRDSMDVTDFEYLQLSVDATFKKTDTSDMVAMELWGIYKGGAYLWRLVNKRMGFVETCEKIRQFAKEFPQLDELVIEDKANGSAIIDTLKYSTDMPSIVGVNPLGGKYSRAQAVSPFVSTHSCHIPNKFTDAEERDIEWSGAEQNLTGVQKFVLQHSRFPFAKNDDMVDASSQALARITKLITGEEPKPQRRFIRFNKWYPDMWEDYNKMNSYEQELFIAKYGAPLEWEDL